MGNRYPLSEPEHDSHTKNSLMNDQHSTNEPRKILESACDYVCDFFIDHDLGECKKCTLHKSPGRNLNERENVEKPKSSSSNQSQSSQLQSRRPSIRRSRRL
mmetsp:Transcript_14392/g.12670  ORF Transcript_14392/g.12670 Transcript_14392/m.12670 type:complete len:102 (-) Transcript_14392:228-533(-)